MRFPRSPSGVYYLYLGEEIIYIGQSRNVFHRVGEHGVPNGIRFDSWEYIPTQVDDLIALESTEILRHRPKLNRLERFKSTIPGHLKELRRLARREFKRKQKYQACLREERR